MTRHPPARRRRPVLRFLAVLVALGLTALGIYWIGVSSSAVLNRVGFPVALWGVLIGAYALRGTRSTQLRPSNPEPDDETAATVAQTGGDIERRRRGEVEIDGDAEQRREYQLQLEAMLRREMERILGQGLAALRADVAGLRGEVLDAVDGRLRLERIETTRIIGSDLAALQNEIRRLNVERESVPIGRPGREFGVINAGNAITSASDQGGGNQGGGNQGGGNQGGGNRSGGEPAEATGMRRETDLWTPSSAGSTGVVPDAHTSFDPATGPAAGPANVTAAGPAKGTAAGPANVTAAAPAAGSESPAAPAGRDGSPVRASGSTSTTWSPSSAITARGAASDPPAGPPQTSPYQPPEVGPGPVDSATAPTEQTPPASAPSSVPATAAPAGRFSYDAGDSSAPVPPDIQRDPFAALPRLSAFRVADPWTRSAEAPSVSDRAAELPLRERSSAPAAFAVPPPPRTAPSSDPAARPASSVPQPAPSGGEYVGRRRQS
ncbi:MAG: hypothetical protein ABJA87_00235 [bacterium]